MQNQGLVPEQKWHISVSLGPICLKLLSQALVSFSSMPNTHIYIHTSSHTHSPSYSYFNWFSTPGNWSGENFQAAVMSEKWKSIRLSLLKTRAAQRDELLEDLISISCFPFKIKAIKDNTLKKIKSFPGCVHRESRRHMLRGGVSRGWRGRKWITSPFNDAPPPWPSF